MEAVALDNRYTAAVMLLTPGGTRVIDRQSANQTVEGAESRVRLNVTGAFGSHLQAGRFGLRRQRHLL